MVITATLDHEYQTVIDRSLAIGEITAHPNQKRTVKLVNHRDINIKLGFVPVGDVVSTVVVVLVVTLANVHRNPLSIGTRVTVDRSPVALLFTGVVLAVNEQPCSSLTALLTSVLITSVFKELTVPSLYIT